MAKVSDYGLTALSIHALGGARVAAKASVFIMPERALRMPCIGSRKNDFYCCRALGVASTLPATTMTIHSTAGDEPAPLRFGAIETAITTFERIHGLAVTVHDLVGSLAPFIGPDRFHHRSPLCLSVKAQGRHEACVRFDVEQLRPQLGRLPEGRIHVCHAGLVEWVVPVFAREKLAWVLFAGPRFPGPSLLSAARTVSASWPKSPWSRGIALPTAVGEDEAQRILEHLRQLAARLRELAERKQPTLVQRRQSPDAFSRNSVTKREVAILRFIEEHYTAPVTLAMLARRLCLSESRTSHVVRQSCKASFRDLVIDRRLRAAMELLRDSGMSVLQVTMACGFEDVAHFHRTFRRRVGLTPARYRTSGRS